MKPTMGTFEINFEGKKWTGFVTGIEESCDDDVFIRYQTPQMFNFMEPLLKIDMKRKRAYFLTDRCSEGLISFPEFQTRGIPCKVHCDDVSKRWEECRTM